MYVGGCFGFFGKKNRTDAIKVLWCQKNHIKSKIRETVFIVAQLKLESQANDSLHSKYLSFTALTYLSFFHGLNFTHPFSVKLRALILWRIHLHSLLWLPDDFAEVWESRCLWIMNFEWIAYFSWQGQLLWVISVSWYQTCKLLPDRFERAFLCRSCLQLSHFWALKRRLYRSENSIIFYNLLSCLCKCCTLFKICALHDTGGGAGMWLWDRAALWGHMAEQLECQVQRSDSKYGQWVSFPRLKMSYFLTQSLWIYCFIIVRFKPVCKLLSVCLSM